jgi:predicted regulator of Ras-like GTPase activity (Roadblock/LC7/MglB family)
MDNETYSFALKNVLDEIRNACPDITSAFMFKENGEMIIGDEKTPEKTMVQVVEAFDGVFEKANAIGHVECITIDGNNGRVNISCMNDLYFVTVTSRKADMNYVSTVTRVLIPTVLRLLERINPASLKNNSILPEPKPRAAAPLAMETEETEPVKETEEEIVEKPKETEPEIKPEPLLPEPPVNQLIVENLGGLLVPSDTVRIDSVILSQWEELYTDRKIEEIEIETFDGKSTRCKVKPIKDSKYEGKGMVQMPEKIQSALEIKKGELVRAKPIVE